MTTPTVISYVLGRLKDVGIDDIFGVTGDFAFPVTDAIVTHPEINWIGCCNELNAAYAADGYARIRGVGAVCTTYGVGELSALCGVAGSYAEQLPVFHLTSMPNRTTQTDRAVVHHTLGNGESGLFRAMADHVVAASAVITPANAAAETERLIAAALYHRRPVYLAFPADVVDQPILARADAVGLPRSLDRSLSAAADAVHRLLDSATSACVLPGVILRRTGLADAARRFIEVADLPFATMFADKSVLDETHPNYVGMYDGRLMDEAVREFVESCDVVVNLGAVLSDLSTGAFTAQLDPSRTIDISLHHTRAGGIRYDDVEMGDILRDLAGRKFRVRSRPRLDPESLGPVTGSGSDPITAAALYPRWAEFLREDDIVFAESGTCSMGLAFAPLPRGARFDNQTLWAAVGWATPASFGAAVAAPERRLVLITGDGAHQFTAQEISQFARRGLRPVIFVLNNSGYLSERMLSRDPGTPYNDVAAWNYAELPRALGAADWYTVRVATCGELDDALTEAAGNDRACYIEVLTGTYEAPPLSVRLSASAKSLYNQTSLYNRT